MNRCSSLFTSLALALAYAPSTQAETAAFESGMIQPFSLVFAEDGTAYGVEYEKGNRVFSISPDGKVQFIAGRNTPGGKKLGDVAEGDGGNMAEARFNGMHELAALLSESGVSPRQLARTRKSWNTSKASANRVRIPPPSTSSLWR